MSLISKFAAIAVGMLIGSTLASIPTTCVTPVEPEVGTADPRGEAVSIDDSVAELATPETEFFGVQVCSEIATGRLVSVVFFLKDPNDEELIEMPRIGPEVAEDLVDCPRRKLQTAEYYVDRVIVY